MKKRWVLLVLLTVVIGGAAIAFGVHREPPTVDTTVLRPRAVEQTVTCSGAVEAGECTGEFVPMPCVVREVTVQEGQQVEVGDVLAVIDKDATRQLLGGDKASLLALAAMEEEITASVQGVVVAVKAQKGEVLAVDSPCAVVAPRSSLQVRVSIREKDLPRLKTGMTVRVKGDGFTESAYDGTLTEISSTASLSGTGAVVEGVVTLAEGQADSSLRLGLTAKAEVITDTAADGLVVPYEAVVTDSDGVDYVYLLKNGRACRQALAVVAQLSDGVLLADHSLEGATVILQPDKITEDGMAVTGQGEDL